MLERGLKVDHSTINRWVLTWPKYVKLSRTVTHPTRLQNRA